MSEEAFVQKVRGPESEIEGIQQILHTQRTEINETEARLERAHSKLKEAQNGLAEFRAKQSAEA